MQEVFQELVNLVFLDLHVLEEVSILEECISGVVPYVCFSGCTCCLPLLMGLVGAPLHSKFLAMVVFPYCGALNGTYVVVVLWQEVLPRCPP